MPKYAKDRNEVSTVALDAIHNSLRLQGATGPEQFPDREPQLQFIISNRYYEAAALHAMTKANALAAAIVPTGMGGWSLELLYRDDNDTEKVRDAYNRACDKRGLY